MFKNMLLLITLGFSLLVGGFWALKAQDPAPQNPSQVRTDPPTVSAQQTVQTDLSGTYTGTFNCEGLGLTGPTTLTINGNEFTTAEGKKGRIVASTTGGYTAVALQLDATDPTAPPQIVSLRGRKSGTHLTLMPVSGTAAGQRCSFVPGRTMARGRRQRTPAATGTDVSNPTAVPAESPTPSTTPAASPMPEQTPSPSPTEMPSPTPSGSPTPMPTPSPGEPTPSPSPSEPMPSPSPSEPMPSPSPSPTPTPTPTPRG
jgi:hypothetical protein